MERLRGRRNVSARGIACGSPEAGDSVIFFNSYFLGLRCSIYPEDLLDKSVTYQNKHSRLSQALGHVLVRLGPSWPGFVHTPVSGLTAYAWDFCAPLKREDRTHRTVESEADGADGPFLSLCASFWGFCFAVPLVVKRDASSKRRALWRLNGGMAWPSWLLGSLSRLGVGLVARRPGPAIPPLSARHGIDMGI